MAVKTRSAVFAVVRETDEATLTWPSSGSEFTVLRQGFTFEGAVETITSDELLDDIGATEPFITKETPSLSIPKYAKHSGVEGQEPDYGVMIESGMGDKFVQTHEPVTLASSTAGDDDNRAVLKADSSVAATGLNKGCAVLIKDGTNGYSIRNVWDRTNGEVELSFNLATAPASGVGLGKAIHYKPAADGHPTYSGHLHQSSTGAAFHDAMAGVRTTSMAWEFPANGLGTVTFSGEGVKFFRNPRRVTSSNKYIDFNIGGSELTAILDEGSYKSPIELARAAETKMNAAASTNDIKVRFSSTTGKYTLSKGSGTLQLLWDSGSNTANSAASLFGYDDSADDTGALSYTADDDQSYDPEHTPSFDDVSPNVVKANELLIGNFNRYLTRQAQTASFTFDTPKTDLDDLSADTGVSESVTLERTVTMSTTLYVKKHEVDDFDAFINNRTVSIAFNHGQKLGGNWVPGTCVNIYMANAKLTATPLGDADGVMVYEVEASGFVSATQKDGHINLI